MQVHTMFFSPDSLFSKIFNSFIHFMDMKGVGLVELRLMKIEKQADVEFQRNSILFHITYT